MHVFGGMKKLVQLKFVQLLLLNRVKGKMIKKPCCSRFLLHKFVQLKYFWTQFKNVHLQGPCSLRPCISRPYCTYITETDTTEHIIHSNDFVLCIIFLRILSEKKDHCDERVLSWQQPENEGFGGISSWCAA